MYNLQSDSHPFGMMMPGRKYTAGSGYRYGFNGKEKSDEVHGEGNIYDYGFRIYNPRIGRFLSMDPLFRSYPHYTPFQFAGNNPNIAIDLDGLEEKVAITIGVNSDPKIDNALYAKAIQIAAYSVHKQVKANELGRAGKANGLQDALQGAANFSLDDGWFTNNRSYTKEQFMDLTKNLYNYIFEAAHYWTNDFEKLYNTTITSTDNGFGGDDPYGVGDYAYNTIIFDKIEELNNSALSVVKSAGEAATVIAGAATTPTSPGNGPKGSKFSSSPRSKPIIPKTEISTGINNRTLIRKTKGGTKVFETNGGFKQADTDFNSMELSNIQIFNTKYGLGKSGTLSNGNQVIIRPGSSDGRATLEVQRTTSKGVLEKIEETRYNH